MLKNKSFFLFSTLILLGLVSFPILTDAQEPSLSNKIIDKTTCDFNYCCSDLTISDYNASTLSKFEASKTSDMVTKIGTIDFKNVTKLKTGQIRICGYIKELHNYWGIKDLWESTWWNNSFSYSAEVSSNQAPNRNESITFFMSEISGWSKAQMQNDCDDVRITNASSNEQLDYWVDICNSTNVRVGFLNKYNISGVIGTVYWGYASAESQNKSMRIFYDDFNDGVFDNATGTGAWQKNSKCVADFSIREESGILNLTNVGANSYCAVMWIMNTSELQSETAYSKIMFTADAGSTGIASGIINTSSTNQGRLLCRRYDSSSKVALDNDDVANGAGVTIPNLGKNVWWWGMIYQNGSTTTGKAWGINVSEPIAETNLASYASRAGWFGVYPASTPAYIQYYDDFQIWSEGYRPTFYATPSTITLSSIMENCVSNYTLNSSENVCYNTTHYAYKDRKSVV
jgi:hypothetical protein